jgi:FixJ family two-component response regulator
MRGELVSEKILFVDDEQDILDGYERLLRREFRVRVARGGEAGLEEIEQSGPFAVVISDMRMPGMNGAEFLAQVRHNQPNTVRMLLTGHADIGAAIAAVNEGNIFRFLTKPCEKEVLVDAINLGIGQYRQTTAERELVRQALDMERRAANPETAEVCQWDDFQGPTGLPGPTQARDYLAPLLGRDSKCYVSILKLTAFLVLEERYGEALSNDYLNYAAQSLVQALHSEDRLFHWERDVLMAVFHRHLSLAAMRTEVSRLAAANRSHLIEVNGRRIMIATPIVFEVAGASQFSTLQSMFLAFNARVGGGE